MVLLRRSTAVIRALKVNAAAKWLYSTRCAVSSFRECQEWRCLSTSTPNDDTILVNENNPVVIVGGGPTGLFMAKLLQSYRVPFVLLEAQTPEQRFQHPQAHFLNTRSMEILKHASALHQCSTKSTYDRLREAMPPVEEWKSFLFGPNMTSVDKMMAKVVHPVDQPLLANTDANGKLTGSNEETRITQAKKIDKTTPLSELSVGHLAQHTFCKILYDAVMEWEQISNDTMNQILYGLRVTDCSFNKYTRRWTVRTDSGKVVECSILIAADGARSFIRSQVLNIPMNGQATIQNLMNVHFQVSPEMEERIPKAMLYTVFASHVLAMVVRHGPGDYVMQIPYFAKYQSPEKDFTLGKVQGMVRTALGISDDEYEGNSDADFSIRSIRPWTMGSLVAHDYYTDTGVFLVGDAAHVFPPAGGFGMNTGLQDVFSLAWRLALFSKSKEMSQSELSDIGSLYQRERQPVARDNAALSVRNYQRVLGVMQACYLDHRHPAALIAALDASSSFLPLAARQQTFRSLLRAAMLPLGQLKASPNGLFARRVKQNLQKLLGSGQGLPLLFPKHELDFSYFDGESYESQSEKKDWTKDSWAYSSRLARGALFPHLPGLVSEDALKSFPHLLAVNGTRYMVSEEHVISTRDLALQLSMPESPCSFCILEICFSYAKEASCNDSILSSMRKEIEKDIGVPFTAARIIVGGSKNGIDELEDCINILVKQCDWDALVLPAELAVFSSSNLFAVMRPDGHVAAISAQNDDAYMELVQNTFQSVARASRSID